jgi:hypothetical protein
MNRLAELSAAERQQLIDDFADEVFSGLDAGHGLAAHLRRAPDLPDNPKPEQVEAWVELAELISDQDFRRRIRAMAEQGARERESGQGGLAASGDADQDLRLVAAITQHAGAATQRGVAPESAEAAEVLRRILGDTQDAQRIDQVLRHAEAFTDVRAERYWRLVGVINGWPPFPARVPAFEWLIAALRARYP